MSVNKEAPSISAKPPALGVGNEHPMLAIPFSVYIDGRQYVGGGISLVQAYATGLAVPALDDSDRLVRLAFDFETFQISVNLLVHIEVVSERELMLRFVDPAGDHLPHLRYVLNGYIAGDLVSVGSAIRSASLIGPASPTAAFEPRPVSSRARSFLWALGVIGLTAALVFTAGTLMYKRIYVADIPMPGRLVAAGETLRAVSSGQISFLDPGAAMGEVVYSIDATNGETLSIAMPCDCEASGTMFREGSTVLAGEPILQLSQAGAPMVIDALVPPDLMFDLQQAGGAEAILADGTVVFATLSAGPMRPVVDAGDRMVPVTLTPETPLARGLAEQVVALRVSRQPGRGSGPLGTLAGGVSDLLMRFGNGPDSADVSAATSTKLE